MAAAAKRREVNAVTLRFLFAFLSVLLATALPAQDAAPVAQGAAMEAEAPAAAPVPSVVTVVLATALGDIRVNLEKDRAPVTVANFLRYVDAKRFDGITLYRALKLDPEGKYGLVQGGLSGTQAKAFKPIAHESPAVTGLRHVDGAISMARLEPGTATAEFFIVIGDLASLDGMPGTEDVGYAVFGSVTEGMDLVRQMLELPRDPAAGEGSMKGQLLADPVKILTVRRAD